MIEKGDFIFFKPRKSSWIENLIAKFDGKYWHVGIMCTKHLLLNQRARGITINTLDDFSHHEIDIFELVDKTRLDKLIVILMLLNRPYDYLGLLRFIFPNFIKPTGTKFYCSEFLAYGLVAVGYDLEDTNISPLQLSNLPILQYKGTITI